MDPSESFFRWVRDASEARWAANALRSDEEVLSSGILGTLPRPDTRWREALTDNEIDACEARFSVRFPSSYRRMLRVMGGTTAMRRVHFDSTVHGTDPTRPAISSTPGWLDPRFDEAAIRERIADLPSWLWPSVADEHESGHAWPAAFGADPGERTERLARIAEWLARAPKAWPMFGHRFLILDESTGAAPVLSIWHCNDTIVYGRNLEEYLLAELGLVAPPELSIDVPGDWDARRLPMWGEIIG
jgi:hypothetical protein